MNKKQIERINNFLFKNAYDNYLGYSIKSGIVEFRFTNYVNSSVIKRLIRITNNFVVSMEEKKILDLVNTDLDKNNNTGAKKIYFLQIDVNRLIKYIAISTQVK